EAASIGQRTVMGIVEQQPVGAAAAVAVLANASHQLMLIPLVHQYQVDAGKRLIEVECAQFVRHAVELGVGGMEVVEGIRSLLGQQILQTPAEARFEYRNPMTASQ